MNKAINRITFKTKTEYYLDLLTPETMKLLGNTKSKINKNENGEKLLYLEITEVVLIHGNVANNTYQINQKSCIHLFVINRLVSY